MIDLNNANITFIGAGKAAYSLVPAFLEKKLNINAIINRNIESAKILANKYSIKISSNSVLDIPLITNVFFISVPDDEIISVQKELLNSNFSLKNKFVLHLSGAKTSDLLSELNNNGAKTASFHIMQTFPSREKVSIKNSYAAIETKSEECGIFLNNICDTLELKGFRLTADAKVHYHLMGTLASNFLVEKFFNIENCTKALGSNTPNPVELLQPIMNQTLENIKNKGAVKSLSGPIERGDLQTVKEHIAAISNDKPFKLVYAAVSMNLVNIASEKGSIDLLKADQLREYLRAEIKDCL